MRALAVTLVLGLVAAGCLEGSTARQAGRPAGYRLCTTRELRTNGFRSACVHRVGGEWKIVQVSSGAGAPRVAWAITYGVGYPERRRSALARCPAGARCTITRDRDMTYSNGAHPWIEVAVRRLACAASGPQPSGGCRAIAALRHVLATRPAVACSCPAMATIAGRAVARIRGRRVIVPLDVCTYCGRSTRATAADLRLLQPQA